jgi:signal transduction histidine kinase
MNRLVDDMLDLERLDRGQITPERDPTDVGELARRVALEVPGMDTHPVRVDADPVLVEVDPSKVERIIENLLTNAGRHTAAGIPVHIEIRQQPKGVLLVIEDEGTGIPDELKEELFEPFRQGPTAAGRGVGIGLSLVKRFAELHGGTAVIEDRPGGGARFVISLPGKVSKAEPAAERHLHAV